MSEERVIDALQDCLERIEAGAAPADVLARHPELRAELEPRLVSALTVRAWKAGSAPAFGAGLRARLSEVDAERAKRGRLLAFSRWQAPLMRAAAIILGVGLALGTASYAAASLLPQDHWLQPVVQRVERMREVIFETAAEVLPGFTTAPDESRAPLAPALDAELPSQVEDAPAEARSGSASSSTELDRRSSEDGSTSADAPIGREAEASALIAAQAATAEAKALLAAQVAATPSATAAVIAIAPASPSAPPSAAEPPVQAPRPEPDPTEAPPAEEPEEPAEPDEPDEPDEPEIPDPGPPPGPPPPGNPGQPPVPEPPVATAIPPDTPGTIVGRAYWKRDERGLRQGTRIQIFPANACPEPGARGVRPAAETRTDRDGRFTFDTIPPGQYKVAVLFERGGRGGFRAWAEFARKCSDADVVGVDPGQGASVDIKVPDMEFPWGEPGGPGPGGGGSRGDEPPEPPIGGGEEPPAPPVEPPVEPTDEVPEN